LTSLNLDENDLADWLDIENSIGCLANLRTLVLSRNHIEKISGKIPVGCYSFPSLTSLNVADNPINSIQCVQAIHCSFPLLTSLRISPLSSSTHSTGPQSRFVLIPHLPHLAVLNGSKITKKERNDAELMYLMQCAKELQSQYNITEHADDCIDLQEAFTMAHPEYRTCVLKHGNPLQVRTNKTLNCTGGDLPSFLQTVSITLRSHHAGSMQKGDKIRKLPLTYTIAKLKLLFQSVYGLVPSKQRLVAKWACDDLPSFCELDDDYRDLQHHGITDNAIIEMHEKE
jgi:Leucine-rich repeat (LRR) protein